MQTESSDLAAGMPGLDVVERLRNPYYHTADDRPEHIDFPRFSRVTRGLVAVVERLTAGP